ncbi:hypothetical protein OIU77_007644 [Salix suchowensis]|uniref:Uncharacterized protein n=1 Tax=Salix suchowensis TaxID=1278906 RepID=A0ABQ9AIY3_9ROSI|nr:hypothetical protein OIU77_007644 [Salix suchowensis]
MGSFFRVFSLRNLLVLSLALNVSLIWRVLYEKEDSEAINGPSLDNKREAFRTDSMASEAQATQRTHLKASSLKVFNLYADLPPNPRLNCIPCSQGKVHHQQFSTIVDEVGGVKLKIAAGVGFFMLILYWDPLLLAAVAGSTTETTGLTVRALWFLSSFCSQVES